MLINRETAIDVLENLIGSGFFDDDLRSSLEEIAYCIEAERKGEDLWGKNKPWKEKKNCSNTSITMSH